MVTLVLAGGLAAGATSVALAAAPEPSGARTLIPAGEFLPQYAPGGSQKAVKIAAFYLERTPVTGAKYEAFVKENPAWEPGKPSALFAEGRYLSDWPLTRKKREFPVVFVSYFAASSYCEWKGGRLPTTLEWEYAALDDPKTQIEWFMNPRPPSRVGRGKPNRHGIRDLHGQVWEWTLDFNSSFATADNRIDGQLDKNLFCGSGSMNARDRENYPAFMRYAMRSALRASDVTSSLGFRCAYDSI